MAIIEEIKKPVDSTYTTSKEFREKLELACDENSSLGIPVCLHDDEGGTINVPKDTDLLSYTVQDSLNAIKNNVNGWKYWGKEKIYGIYLLTGKIKSGKLKGKYLVGIDIDSEKAYHAFLDGSSIDAIVIRYKWVIHHTEPYYKIHILIVVDNLDGLSFLNENIVVDQQTKETLGLGIFTEGKWFADSLSVNPKSKYEWELFRNGKKKIEVISEENLKDLKWRINSVCKTIAGFEYGKDNKSTNNNTDNNTTTEGEKTNSSGSDSDSEFDTPTSNFIDYVVRCYIAHFNEGLRDKIVFNLSGYFSKERINIKITKKIVELLQEKHNQKPNITDTEVIGSRTNVIINSYNKVDKNQKVEGFSALKIILGYELAEQFKDRVEEFKVFLALLRNSLFLTYLANLF